MDYHLTSTLLYLSFQLFLFVFSLCYLSWLFIFELVRTFIIAIYQYSKLG